MMFQMRPTRSILLQVMSELSKTERFILRTPADIPVLQAITLLISPQALLRPSRRIKAVAFGAVEG